MKDNCCTKDTYYVGKDGISIYLRHPEDKTNNGTLYNAVNWPVNQLQSLKEWCYTFEFNIGEFYFKLHQDF